MSLILPHDVDTTCCILPYYPYCIGSMLPLMESFFTIS